LLEPVHAATLYGALDPSCVAVLTRVRAAYESIALHEDGLAGAERERVCLPHGSVAERLEVDVPFPEALLEPHPSGLGPEARPVECRLGVEPVVDEGRHELHVRLRLDEAAHDAERPEQVAVPEQHGRDDRVERPAARFDGPGDGEAGAAVLKDDA